MKFLNQSPFRFWFAAYRFKKATPIARQHRWLYPIDWRELSALIRFDRAKGRCEHCRRPHGRDVVHLVYGTWWDDHARR